MIRSIAIPACLAVLLAGCSQGEEAFNNSFNERFRSSCIESAQKGAPTPDVAVKYCDCVLAKVDEKYSAMEKVALSPEELTPLMNECMNSVVPPNG